MILNRRHLRIKVLQTLYAYSQQDNVDFLWAKKELFKSIDQIYDLYILLLQIFPELKDQAERRATENKKKMLPTEEDLNPNPKFMKNKVIEILDNNINLNHFAEELKANWRTDSKQELIRKLYNHIRQSEVYFEFMNNELEGFEEDKAFMIQLFKTEIANFPLLYDFLEEKSVYWVDDIDLVCSMVIKTIKGFQPEYKEDSDNKESSKKEVENNILPLYKPDDDEKEFVSSLLRETIKRKKDSLQIIDSLTQNWELDRIAKMDVLLMKMAIAELISFNNIPTKVTLNEYIEISKFYSTPKSNSFINGILDKVISTLEKEGKIKKTGRGLLK